MPNKLYLFGIALVFFVTTKVIVDQERLVANGELVLLKLAPVDPRSLMQGDYMILRYAMTRRVGLNARSGRIVIALDAKKVARFVRVHDGKTALKANERLLLFRKRKGRLKIAQESFFFQEGHGKMFAKAKFGALRVTKAGKAILVDLYDARHQRIGPKRF